MKTTLHLTFVAIVFPMSLLSLGCQKKTAAVNPSPQSKSALHEDTKYLRAADLVGYDGTKLGNSLDHIKETNDKQNQEMEKMLESEPDQ